MKKDLRAKFAVQRAFFDTGYCAVYSFCIASMLAKGYKASEAGIIMFLANIISFISQPLVASVVDRSSKNLLNKFIAAEQGVGAFLILIDIFFIKSKLLFGILFTLGLSSIDMNNSLFNAISVYYKRRGWQINYELSRASGAVMFAFGSLLFGVIMDKLGCDVVITIGVCLFVSLVFMSLSFPNDDSAVVQDGDTKKDASSLVVFAKNNPWFCASLLGIILLALVHVMVENYLIEVVTRIGGSSSSVGIGLFAATIIEAPVMYFFSHIHKKIGTYNALLIAGLSYILKVVLFICAKSLIVIYIAQMLQATSYTFIAPSIMYYARDCIKDSDMVKGQSAVMSAFTLGSAFGCLIGGVIITSFGVLNMLWFGFVVAVLGTLILYVTVPKAKYCSD